MFFNAARKQNQRELYIDRVTIKPLWTVNNRSTNRGFDTQEISLTSVCMSVIVHSFPLGIEAAVYAYPHTNSNSHFRTLINVKMVKVYFN